MHALQRWCVLLISLRIVPRSMISCQTSTRVMVSSWTVLGGFRSHRMQWPMISQRCSMGFKSGERAGQSVVSMPASWKKSLVHSRHMRSGIVLYQEKPRTDCTNAGPNNRSKDIVSVSYTCQISTIKHMQIRTSFWRNASPDHYWPTTEPVMLGDVACLIKFHYASPDLYASVGST